MEAVYGWIRQIAVFAVISYLVLYLMGEQEKGHVLRFYLSLLMMLLILKPVSSVCSLNQVFTEKLTELETDAEIAAAGSQIRQIAQASDQEVLDYVSEQALSRVQELAEDKNLEFNHGKVDFDDEKMEKSGEVVICGMELTVSGGGKQSSEIRPLLKEFREDVAGEFGLDQSRITIKTGGQ